MRSKEVENNINALKQDIYNLKGFLTDTEKEKWQQTIDTVLNYISELEKENTDAKEYADDVWRKQEELRNIIEKVKEFITNHTPSDIGICGNSKKCYYTLGEDSVDKILELLEGE